MFSNYVSSRQNRSLSVLVIEDNPDHQLLIGYSLRTSVPEAEPVFMSTAEETFAYLEKSVVTQTPFPKLVLLDFHLPQPEVGRQLLKELRTRYPHLPVLVLSAHPDPDDVKQAYELGALSFIRKPVGLAKWEQYFQTLRDYWLEVVTLSPVT